MTEGGNSARRERKRSRTRDHLAETALRLFEKNGYEAVTMEEIAAAADVAKGTLYNHFPVKEALLAYSIQLQLANDLQGLQARILREKTFTARLTVLLRASAEWCEAHRSYLPPFIRFELSNASSEAAGDENGMVALYTALIREAQKNGELRRDVAPEHLAALLHYLYFACLMRWLALPSSRLAQEFDAVIDVFVNGSINRLPATRRERDARARK